MNIDDMLNAPIRAAQESPTTRALREALKQTPVAEPTQRPRTFTPVPGQTASQQNSDLSHQRNPSDAQEQLERAINIIVRGWW